MDLDENTNKSRGGQPGNTNQSKNKPFLDAMRRALAQNPHRIASIVDKVLEKAEEGEPWAVKEVADRLDGKSVQATDITSSDGTVVSAIAMSFVEPNGNKD